MLDWESAGLSMSGWTRGRVGRVGLDMGKLDEDHKLLISDM